MKAHLLRLTLTLVAALVFALSIFNFAVASDHPTEVKSADGRVVNLQSELTDDKKLEVSGKLSFDGSTNKYNLKYTATNNGCQGSDCVVSSSDQTMVPENVAKEIKNAPDLKKYIMENYVKKSDSKKVSEKSDKDTKESDLNCKTKDGAAWGKEEQGSMLICKAKRYEELEGSDDPKSASLARSMKSQLESACGGSALKKKDICESLFEAEGSNPFIADLQVKYYEARVRNTESALSTKVDSYVTQMAAGNTAAADKILNQIRDMKEGYMGLIETTQGAVGNLETASGFGNYTSEFSAQRVASLNATLTARNNSDYFDSLVKHVKDQGTYAKTQTLLNNSKNGLVSTQNSILNNNDLGNAGSWADSQSSNIQRIEQQINRYNSSLSVPGLQFGSTSIPTGAAALGDPNASPFPVSNQSQISGNGIPVTTTPGNATNTTIFNGGVGSSNFTANNVTNTSFNRGRM